MRRVIGFGGAVVVVAVAIIALLREKPATASSNADRVVRADVGASLPAVTSTIAPPTETTTTASTVPDPTALASSKDASSTASTASSTTPNGSRSERPTPVRGLVMRADEPSRSPGASTTMSKDSIKNAIRAVTPKIQECYERALDQNPNLGGTIKVSFTLQSGDDGKGEVTEGEVADSDVASPFFEACVLKEVAGATFDAPERGGVVKVTYPFHFASSTDDTSSQ